MTEKQGLSTRCVHAGELADPQGSPHTPLYNTTTFAFPSMSAFTCSAVTMRGAAGAARAKARTAGRKGLTGRSSRGMAPVRAPPRREDSRDDDPGRPAWGGPRR